MLKKLMKYEFMAMGRVFLPLFAALIIVSIVNRLLSYLPANIPAGIGVFVSVLLIIGISVIAFVLTLQRFRNNLLSNEGYLMMTLPVCTDSLILSKMFVAAIWYVASFVVVMVSIMTMAMTGFGFMDLAWRIRDYFLQLSSEPLQTVLYSIEWVVIIALSLFSGILLLYACMSLSMLVNKRRGLFTFGAYIAIVTAMQTLIAILLVIAEALDVFIPLWLSPRSSFAQNQLALLMLILFQAAICTAFYFITRHMLKKRLNLH